MTLPNTTPPDTITRLDARRAGTANALAAMSLLSTCVTEARTWLGSAGVEALLERLRLLLEEAGEAAGLTVAERHGSEVSRAASSASRWVGVTFCRGADTGTPGPGEFDVVLRCSVTWPEGGRLVLEAYAPAPAPSAEPAATPRTRWTGPRLLASLQLSRLVAPWPRLAEPERTQRLSAWTEGWGGASVLASQAAAFVTLAAQAAWADSGDAVRGATTRPGAGPRLTCVSLTGADDATDIGELVRLDREYGGQVPLEWALLYVPGREGAPRNPTRAWRKNFFAAIGRRQGTAVHLCGPGAFAELLTGALPDELLLAGRWQLNVNARRRDFTLEQTVDIYERALDCGPDLILQYHERTCDAIHRFLAELPAERRGRVGVLLDYSQGRGVAPQAWSVPAGLERVRCGFAGGIGPDNVAATLDGIAAVHARPYWIDMESGLRSDNRFDLARVRALLDAVRGHAGGIA